MALPGLLLNLGFKHLFDIASKETADWLDARFDDRSRDVLRAVFEANRRSWAVVAAALAEPTFWGRIKGLANEADFAAARDGARSLLALLSADTRARAAEELTALSERLRDQDPESADDASALRRFSDPAGLVAAADRAAADLPDALTDAPNLRSALTFRPDGAVGLFHTFYRYYFRNGVQGNPALASQLAADQLRAMTEALSAQTLVTAADQLRMLGEALDARTVGILDQFDALFDHLDRRFAEVNAKLGGIEAKIDRLLDDRQVSRSVRDPLKVSVTSERELAQLRQWRDELRALPPELVGAGLQTKMGDALAAARLYAEAREAHAAAARTARDRAARAEAEFKAYRDACEQEAWADALPALLRAAELDAPRFAPFPLRRYEPLQIVGAGGFGTVVRCRDRLGKGREVAVKAFHTADLGRDLDEVFAEAHTLSGLAGPGVVRVLHWDFADPDQSRPYLVMEFFDGPSLASVLRHEGRLPVAELVAVARQVAGAMTAAHAAGVLHRDLKPGNILVRRRADNGWDVCVIDFGLAVRFAAAQASVSTSLPHRTRRDLSFAGSLEYASPEQKGAIAAAVGPRSDVYSFGKTMLEALLGTTEPTSRTWRSVSDEYREPLQELLEQCVEKSPTDRHPGFEPIATALAALHERGRLPADRKVVRDSKLMGPQSDDFPGFLPGDTEWRDLAAGLLREAEVEREGRAKKVAEREAAEQRKREEAERQVTGRHEAERRRAEEDAMWRDLAHELRIERPEPSARDPWHPQRERKAGQTLKLKLPGDVPLTLAWCPPGSFLMGSEKGDSDEKPVHAVTLSKGFFLGIHPVTQAQWKAVMGTDPSRFKGPNRPVEQVSWDDAREFSAKLQALVRENGAGAVTVRLPTEAEWEYACRAGTTTEYGLGNHEAQLRRVGWYAGNSGGETHPVGQLEANSWGLFDVHGNVWEWCLDPKRGYGTSAQVDPQGELGCALLVVRGGGLNSSEAHCSAGSREVRGRGFRGSAIGFRICMRLD